MTPPPTLEEVDGMIARFTVIREKWKGIAAYARLLDIELYSLRLLAARLAYTEQNEDEHI